MIIPLQISFHHTTPSDEIEAAVRKHAQRLDRYFAGIMSCRVVVEAPHGRRFKGNLYRVRVDVTVPGAELVASRAPDRHSTHENLYVAIRDAFHAVRRELEDYARKRRRQVKRHDERRGRVVRLMAQGGYGYLRTQDHRELYFHAHSVLDGFEKLSLGDEVRYAEEMGDKGPQASTVSLVGRRRRGVGSQQAG